jgi:7-cyano-7-deazaguanine synthase
VRLIRPFVQMAKADIVRRGAELHVPFDRTWSCYKGGEKQCGRCGTCVERREAFHLAGELDPTTYAETAPPIAVMIREKWRITA